MLIRLDTHSGVPIYRQVLDQVRRQVLTGRLSPGDKLASVREVSAELRVNPMTVSKTFNRLTDRGWIVRQRGKATRVALSQPEHPTQSADKQLENEIERLIDHSKQLNLNEQQLVELISKAWNKE